MFVVSEKNTENGLLIVVTDQEIFGKVFEEGNKQLDLTKKFYQGEKKEKKEVINLFEKARHVHLTGKNSVELGIKLGLVDKKRVLVVDGIEHAEVFFE